MTESQNEFYQLSDQLPEPEHRPGTEPTFVREGMTPPARVSLATGDVQSGDAAEGNDTTNVVNGIDLSRYEIDPRDEEMRELALKSESQEIFSKLLGAHRFNEAFNLGAITELQWRERTRELSAEIQELRQAFWRQQG